MHCKKKTFGEVLTTNYDEIYHRNEPTLRCDHSSQGYAQEPQPLHLDPFHSPPPLSPFEQLMAKMDERDRKMDDRLERLKKHDNSFDINSKSSSIFSNFCVGHEVNIESKVLCELEESYNKNLLVESASNSTLSTLTPPLCQEKELIVDDNCFTACDEDEKIVLF